jgi:hypothetical protein
MNESNFFFQKKYIVIKKIYCFIYVSFIYSNDLHLFKNCTNLKYFCIF